MRTQVCRFKQRRSGALRIKSPWTKPQQRSFNRELWGLEVGEAARARADGMVRRRDGEQDGERCGDGERLSEGKIRGRGRLGHWLGGGAFRGAAFGRGSAHHEESRGCGFSLARKTRVPVLQRGQRLMSMAVRSSIRSRVERWLRGVFFRQPRLQWAGARRFCFSSQRALVKDWHLGQ
jgi:hypothetical protein